MGKPKKGEESGTKEEEVLDTPKASSPAPSTRPPRPMPKRLPKLEPVFSFDRYFATLGKPIHHKAGMKAFVKKADLRSKKTVQAWNRIFAAY